MKRLIQLVIAAGIFGVFVLVFIVMNLASMHSVNLRDSYTLQITDWPKRESKQTFYTYLRALSTQHASSEYKIIHSRSGHKRTCVRIAGQPLTYRSFNPYYPISTTTKQPLSTTADIRGTYVITGSSQWIQQFLTANHLTGTITRNDFLSDYQNIFTTWRLANALWLYLILLFSALTFYAFYACKATVFRFIHGYTWFKITNHYLKSIAHGALKYIIGWEILVAAFLFTYNTGDNILLFLGLANLFSVLLILTAIILFYLVFFAMFALLAQQRDTAS